MDTSSRLQPHPPRVEVDSHGERAPRVRSLRALQSPVPRLPLQCISRGGDLPLHAATERLCFTAGSSVGLGPLRDAAAPPSPPWALSHRQAARLMDAAEYFASQPPGPGSPTQQAGRPRGRSPYRGLPRVPSLPNTPSNTSKAAGKFRSPYGRRHLLANGSPRREAVALSLPPRSRQPLQSPSPRLNRALHGLATANSAIARGPSPEWFVPSRGQARPLHLWGDDASYASEDEPEDEAGESPASESPPSSDPTPDNCSSLAAQRVNHLMGELMEVQRLKEEASPRVPHRNWRERRRDNDIAAPAAEASPTKDLSKTQDADDIESDHEQEVWEQAVMSRQQWQIMETVDHVQQVADTHSKYARQCDEVYVQESQRRNCTALTRALQHDEPAHPQPVEQAQRAQQGERRQDEHALLLLHAGITEPGLAALSVSLPSNQTVTSLALCSNDIKGAAVEALVSGLANNSVLTQLDLSHNPIGNPGAKMLAGLLVYRKQHKQGLRELSLCGCDLGDSGASALFHAVAQGAGNRQLQALNLGQNLIGDSTMRVMADALIRNRSLRELDLAWNNVQAGGAVSVGTMLELNSGLQVLNLAWNGLDREGGVRVCASLISNAHLRSLDLSHTRATQEVCLVVCELLRVNSILQALYLDGNRLGAQGGGHLVRAAQSSSSLYTLSFRDCDLSKTGLASRNHSRASLNVQFPDKVYQLQLERPEEHAVAYELSVLNRQMGGCCISKAFLDGKSLAASASASWPTELPCKGVVSFEFVSNLEFTGATVPSPSVRGLSRIVTQLAHASLSDAGRMQLLKVIAPAYFFTSLQAQQIIATFAPGPDQSNAALQLFPRLVDQRHAMSVMMRGVSSLTKAALSEGLGKLELFRHTNPSGRYRLDLGREVCRAVAIKLHDLNKQEGRVYNWLNVEIDGVSCAPTYLLPAGWEEVPRSGVLVLDFASHKTPVAAERRPPSPLRPRELHQLMHFMHTPELHGGPPSVACQLERLREKACLMYVGAKQVAEIACTFEEPAARVETVVVLWTRTVDPWNRWRIVYSLEGLEQSMLMRRLGPSLVIHPRRASMHYVLDCANTLHMPVMRALAAQALKDTKRTNLHNLRVNGKLVRAKEDQQLWRVLTTDSDTPVVEFDFLGEDWFDVVHPASLLEGEKPSSAPTQVAMDRMIKQWAQRCEVARMRLLQPWFEEATSQNRPGHKPDKSKPLSNVDDASNSPHTAEIWAEAFDQFALGLVRSDLVAQRQHANLQSSLSAKLFTPSSPLHTWYQELKTADDGSIKASLKMEDLMTQVTDNLGTIAAGVVRQAYEAEVDRQLSVQAHEASAPQPHDQEASNKTSKHKKSIPKNEPSTEEQAKLDMLQRLEEAAKAATARRAARRRGGMAVSELTRGSLSWTDFKLLFSIRNLPLNCLLLHKYSVPLMLNPHKNTDASGARRRINKSQLNRPNKKVSALWKWAKSSALATGDFSVDGQRLSSHEKGNISPELPTESSNGPGRPNVKPKKVKKSSQHAKAK